MGEGRGSDDAELLSSGSLSFPLLARLSPREQEHAVDDALVAVGALRMRKAEYLRAAKRRIARAEADCNATVLRAFDKFMNVLARERTEIIVRMDREKKGV